MGLTTTCKVGVDFETMTVLFQSTFTGAGGSGDFDTGVCVGVEHAVASKTAIDGSKDIRKNRMTRSVCTRVSKNVWIFGLGTDLATVGLQSNLRQ